jgi:hypothetical protein
MRDGFTTTRNDIIYELNAMIRELHEIAGELKSVQGLGTELCTSKLQHIAAQCERTKGQLIRING